MENLFSDRIVAGTDSREALGVLRALPEPIIGRSFPAGLDRRPVSDDNINEYSMRGIAEMEIEPSGSRSELVFGGRTVDDPRRLCSDITRAREVLRCEPRVPAEGGFRRTFEWFAGGRVGEVY